MRVDISAKELDADIHSKYYKKSNRTQTCSSRNIRTYSLAIYYADHRSQRGGMGAGWGGVGVGDGRRGLLIVLDGLSEQL